ncbi:MAG: hypothetical protein HY332_20480 [Chloroflexi bacterium]|nr:hypothetical protein [Chloroflexota bacterium]
MKGEADARQQKLEKEAGAVLSGWLAALRTGEPRAHGTLTVVPLYARETAPVPPYRTLAAAIASGAVIVTEKAQAQVPTLHVENRGALLVLILDGEEVVGGRQNRIVNSTLLVPPRCSFPLPVSCVEHGRWHAVDAAFAPGESAYPTLRSVKAQHVTASYARAGVPVADQGAVWEEIASLRVRDATASITGAMRDVYLQRHEALEQAERALAYPDDAPVGIVAVAQEHAFCADIFDHPTTLRSYWPRLVRSYALEAATAETATAQDAVTAAQRLLERAARARRTGFASPGLGQDIRLESQSVVGACLVHDGAAIHTAVFRRQQTARNGTGAARAIRRLSQRARYLGAQ